MNPVTIAAPMAEAARLEKTLLSVRLVAVTHGDPTKASDCGRPITYRPTRVNEKRSADQIAVCPLHGDLLETARNGDGYIGAFAFFADDRRPRRRSE